MSIAQKVRRNVLPQHLDTRHLFLYTSEFIPSILEKQPFKKNQEPNGNLVKALFYWLTQHYQTLENQCAIHRIDARLNRLYMFVSSL